MIGICAKATGEVVLIEYSNLEGRKFDIIVDEIPEPQVVEGKYAVLFLDLESQKLAYKYFSIQNVSEETEIDKLNAEVQGLQNAITELTMMMAAPQ